MKSMFESRFCYVIKCNQKEDRYLGFTNSVNKMDIDSGNIKVAQTDPKDLSTALYFLSKSAAEDALEIYKRSGKMKPEHFDKLELVQVEVFNTPDVDFRSTTTNLGFTAYMDRKAFNRFVYS